MNAHTELVPRTTITSICQAREVALIKMAECADALEAAYAIGAEAKKLAHVATMGHGDFTLCETDHHDSRSLFPRRGWDKAASLEGYRKALDVSVWRHLLDAAGVKTMMDRQALDELDKSLRADVPLATLDNVQATLETLMRDSDLIFKRGLANAFSGLDRRFKSHDGFKIGRRIIFNHAFSEYSGSCNYGGTWDSIADVERVLAVLDGQKPEIGKLKADVDRDRRAYGAQQSQTHSRYFRLDGFKNNNAHLWFTRDDLIEKANKILAEFYGEVIPDAYDEGDDSDLFNRSTAVSKDLQFYRSPDHVVAELLDQLALDGARVLEPSAGDGAIALAAATKGARVDAIEFHQDRCDLMRARAGRLGSGSVSVNRANFLQITPSPIYDFVLMNPPFHGTHYMDHVRHAFKFLRPGGILRAVLPASAEINESKKHIAFRAWAKPLNDRGWRGPFQDLPPESFADSGTRINTVVMSIRKRD